MRKDILRSLLLGEVMWVDLSTNWNDSALCAKSATSNCRSVDVGLPYQLALTPLALQPRKLEQPSFTRDAVIPHLFSPPNSCSFCRWYCNAS